MSSGPRALERKLKLSMNPELINRNEAGDKTLYAEGFRNVEATIPEIREGVHDGWALAPQFRGRRQAKNFLCSDVACVDIDNGTSLEEIRNRPLIRDYAALLYTTVSCASSRTRHSR